MLHTFGYLHDFSRLVFMTGTDNFISDSQSLPEVDVSLIDTLMSSDPKSLGKRVAEERKNCGMTQAELAKEIGVGIDTISRIENGDETVAIGTIRKIAGALSISELNLATTTQDIPPQPSFYREKETVVFLNNLIRLMGENDMSRADLAKALDMEYNSVSAWFTGARRPNTKALKRLGQIFGVKGYDLFKEKSPPQDDDMLKELIEANLKILKVIESRMKDKK